MNSASAICGVFMAAYTISVSAYITEMGVETENQDKEVKVNKYFGIYYSMFQTSQIWGNLISYFLLKQANRGENNSDSVRNHTCGAEFLEKTYELETTENS
ncbi:unnamed protein product, partial [Didymodactylos carnosus]